MIYPNLHAILATRVDGLIGDGDHIPWHHSGDMKHFKKTTENAALIIGFKTLEGIAKNYFKNGKEVLLGRRLYVSYEDRYNWDHQDLKNALSQFGNFSKTEVYNLPSAEDYVELKALMVHERNSKVFVAGGAKTYKRYMPFVSNIYMTLITQVTKTNYSNPVYLSSDLQQFLFNHEVGMSTIKPSEHEGSLIADYFQINRLVYGGVGDGFSEF